MTDACTLLVAITTTEFISALVITNECLHYFLGLTRSLQQEAKDIVQAVSEVTTLTSTFKEVRENVDPYHDDWFKTVSDMCTEVGTTPSMSRICGRQRHRASTPASSPSEYFRRTITVPMLDHLLAELNRWFSSHQKTALQLGFLFGTVTISETKSCHCVQQGGGSRTVVQGRSPRCIRVKKRDPQLVYQMEERDHGCAALPSSLATTLPKISEFYTNIKALITVLCTLPVTSCSAERSFSGLKQCPSL